MMKHFADGFRVYDGCPDSTLQRRLDAEAAEIKRLTEAIAGLGITAHVTYFPMEGKYAAFSQTHRMLSALCNSRIEALSKAFQSIIKDF